MLFRNDKRDPQSPPPSGLRVPLLPLRDIIVFPHMVVPLFVGRQKSIRALEEAMGKQKSILLAAQKDAKTNEPAEDDIYRVGTLGSVKGLSPADVRASGARIMLSNTYHLALQPGVATVERLGGLHAFTRWRIGPSRPSSRLASASRVRATSAASL